MSIFQGIYVTITTLHQRIGAWLSWLYLPMILLMFMTVIARYLFDYSAIWHQELVQYLHAFILMALAGYTLADNDHVRVDVFYQHAKPQAKAWINLLGHVFFLIPFCVALFYLSARYILSAWAILEPSPEPQGLPGVFLLKSLIWVYGGSLLLQAIALLAGDIEAIHTHQMAPDAKKSGHSANEEPHL